ncbi:MAG: L-fucose/L-arabinose isomerase family protein [Armatimonadota bacterium]
MTTGLSSVKLGYVPISKFVFSQEDARRYKQFTEARLTELGINFVNIDGITSDDMLSKNADLPKVVQHLRDNKVDALFCPHCNFGTEDVAARLGKEMGLPYLLWGPRDEMPLADGSRLRDTQCGLFATSRILSRLDVPFTYIPNCRLDDPIFNKGLLGFMQVASTVKAMRTMRIGQIGQRIDFFWTVMVNEAELMEKFGIEVWQVYADDVFRRMTKLIDAPTAELRELVRQMRGQVRFESLNEKQVDAIAALKLVMTDIAEKEHLSAIAIQCFPTIQQAFGIYPCYANSLLTIEGVPVICETDIHGAVTSALLQAATLNQRPPFFADLTIRHPENDNAELLWHCGSFPVNLADEGIEPKVGEHFIMPGADAGVGHWRIKGGDITVARFDVDHGKYSLGFGEGKGTTGPHTVGAYVWFEVEDWLAWERKLIRGPYIHHMAGVHGKLAPILQEACRYIPHLQADSFDQTPETLDDFWYR